LNYFKSNQNKTIFIALLLLHLSPMLLNTTYRFYRFGCSIHLVIRTNDFCFISKFVHKNSS